MSAPRLLLLLGCQAATAQLVGPGALVPGGGPQNNRRSGGWGVVDQWPVGFFVGGSDLTEMNGIYVRQADLDHKLPHYCELSWKHIDNDFKVASATVRGWFDCGVLWPSGSLTPSTRLASIRRGRGWFHFRV